MIGRVRKCVLAFLAGLWGVDQCEGCSVPITGEPYVDAEGCHLCAACWWVAEVDTESVL